MASDISSVLVSRALPKGIEFFGQIDGVWVCAPRFSIGLAVALRRTLIVGFEPSNYARARNQNGACLRLFDAPLGEV
ncbi:DUF2130 domain-containing protein [uncultured Cohaesibacter sp.]|uniref:DUF2130 domain-containing protein n=1 Tax=uncultured Cohaesibacter sp. TaxID=1002546 RepID=UPI002AA83EF8|nr:DUF2130 domain-containing protein [uncultured Cohaesibacter sp.]